MTTIALRLDITTTAPETAGSRGLTRRVLTWELAGVLTLMGSSAAYAVFALSHLV